MEENEKLAHVRHSLAHLLASAVLEFWPDAKNTIGPAIDNGFYYDFDFPEGVTISDADFTKIEAKMQEIVEAARPFVRKSVEKAEAAAYFKEAKQNYKLELLQSIGDATVSLYQQGSFVDLCRGPHVPHTGWLKSFKLIKLAGAYWRGDEKNAMLQRLYGTAFFDPKELKQYLNNLEEAKKRDHRKLGKELELFTIQDQVGPGLILWQPKGALIRRLIEDFWRDEHYRNDYELLYTPHIAKLDLWIPNHQGIHYIYLRRRNLAWWLESNLGKVNRILGMHDKYILVNFV